MKNQHIEGSRLSMHVFEHPVLSLSLSFLSLFAAIGFAFVGAIILATHANTLAMNIGIVIVIIGIILSFYTMSTLKKVITVLKNDGLD